MLGGFRDVIIAKQGLEIVMEMINEDEWSTFYGVAKWWCHFLFFACCSTSSFASELLCSFCAI